MARAIDAKAKAKRQKIVAIVGAVILVGLVAWRVPQMMSILNKKPPPGSNPTVATPSPVAPAVPGAPATPGTPVPATPAGQLADSDPAPVAGPGQLVSFGRFVSKDPFVQQTGQQCADDSGQTIACAGSGGSGSGAAPRPKKPSKAAGTTVSVQPTAPTKAASSAAQISVNGSSEGVTVGASFPVSDPMFKLVSVTGRTAKIAIDGGSYADGSATITLKKGQPVTLVNTADGTRYRLLLL
jgi:hypothetical protein